MLLRRLNAAFPRVVVIGAGIGGLTTGALLADAGYDVTVLETEPYPGGSAGTFFHQGYRYDAGATLAGGFHPDGPHTLVGERLGIAWPVRETHPAWTVHLPDRQVALSRDYADVIAQFPASERFWRAQEAVAETVWAMSAQGIPWPPQSVAELWRLARTGITALPGSLSVLPLAFQSARDWFSRFGLDEDTTFMRFADAQLLISAQTTSSHANALYSATALDLARQGVYHVQGGIGGLAQSLAEAIQVRGGRVLYKHRASTIDVVDGGARAVIALKQRREEVRIPADFVIANLTPWSLDTLLGAASPARLRREVARRDLGWGAFVLYLGVNTNRLPQGLADHHQIVTEMDGPLGEGRSIFVSMSPAWDDTRAPQCYRAVTVTTHTVVQPWWDLIERDPEAYKARKALYTERLLAGIDGAIPGFRAAIDRVMPGTPVTYQTWTNRHLGMVGGFPQVSLFTARGPRTGIPNVRLVGDSIFPGQSTAAVTFGAMRVAADVQRVLPRSLSGTVVVQPRTELL